MEQQKKLTRDQLERRMKNALVFVPKDKDYKGIFFSDRGIRLEVNADTAVISTGFHRHVFADFTTNGLSRPFAYTKRLIEIAYDNDCKADDGYSFKKLMEVLKAKEDKSEYNLAWFIDVWLFNIFAPLYSIGESEAESFLVYEDYLHNIARNEVILSEKTEAVTNKQFVEHVCDNIKLFSHDLEEAVIFPKKSDEEVMQENIEAAAADNVEQAMGAQADGTE